jgi:type IV pilus assembly protein PilN
MLEINFVPWRERNRKKKQHNFLLCLFGCVLIVVIAMMGFCWCLEKKVEVQQKRNDILQNYNQKTPVEIRQYSLIKKQHALFLKKLRVLHKLTKQQKAVIGVINVLPRLVNRGVVLEQVALKDEKLILQLEGFSHDDANRFFKKISALSFIKNPQLDILSTKRTGDRRVIVFSVNIELKRLC